MYIRAHIQLLSPHTCPPLFLPLRFADLPPIYAHAHIQLLSPAIGTHTCPPLFLLLQFAVLPSIYAHAHIQLLSPAIGTHTCPALFLPLRICSPTLHMAHIFSHYPPHTFSTILLCSLHSFQCTCLFSFIMFPFLPPIPHPLKSHPNCLTDVKRVCWCPQVWSQGQTYLVSV